MSDVLQNQFVQFQVHWKLRNYSWIFKKCTVGQLIGKCCSTLINVRHYILVIIMSTTSILQGIEIIKSCDEERDLGVIISRTLMSGSQCVVAAKSANRNLGMISRTFVNKDSKTMLKLYQSFGRPKLEYCVQAWRPHLYAKGY